MGRSRGGMTTKVVALKADRRNVFYSLRHNMKDKLIAAEIGTMLTFRCLVSTTDSQLGTFEQQTMEGKQAINW